MTFGPRRTSRSYGSLGSLRHPAQRLSRSDKITTIACQVLCVLTFKPKIDDCVQLLGLRPEKSWESDTYT